MSNFVRNLSLFVAGLPLLVTKERISGTRTQSRDGAARLDRCRAVAPIEFGIGQSVCRASLAFQPQIALKPQLSLLRLQWGL